mgnify:CR=1 FL=1
MSRSRSLFAIYQRNSFKDFLIVFFLAESGFVVAHYKKFVLHQIHFVGIQCFRQYTHQRKVDFIFFETVDDLCLVGYIEQQFHALVLFHEIGVLVFSQTLTDEKIAHQEVLSAGGQLAEAARNLYASLHRLDRLQLDVIVAERLPEVSLGLTINDRLERAAKQ